jgi:hypothetical protein
MSERDYSTVDEGWQSQILTKPRIFYQRLDDIPAQFRQGMCMDCGKSVAELIHDNRVFFSLESGGVICRRCLDLRLEDKPEEKQKRTRPGIPKQLRWKVFARDDFTCVACGATGMPLECDHIIPVSKGGVTEEDNLQTLCEACNRCKSCQVEV